MRRAYPRGGRLGVLASLVLAAACSGSTEPAPRSTWSLIAAGMWYSCGLSPTGEAYCWGGVPGYYGPFPLQDSLLTISAVPVRVLGGRRFVEITVGEGPICALDSERAAYCWGANQLGEVGDGSYLAKRGPSPVVGGHRWKVLDGGGAHVCGITLDEKTYCWGNQFRGALGNGQLDGSNPQPVEVHGQLTFSAVYAGPGKSCGLTAEGEAYCWGVNDYGVLGDGEPPEPYKQTATPSPVVGEIRFNSLALGGNHMCGLAQDARAYCWGWNLHGQLGNGTTEHSSSPVAVAGDLRWASLTSGYLHSCGLTTDGAAYCWGLNNHGQFGTGVTGSASSPELIAGAGTYVALTAGGRHTCGRTAAGAALCWGWGEWGQLGNGTMVDRLRPTHVAGYN